MRYLAILLLCFGLIALESACAPVERYPGDGRGGGEGDGGY
ncbi:hypothetical protein [Limibacillus halophilus]|jgi:hypothetical protein